MAFSSHHLDLQVEQEFSEVSGINPFFQNESRESILFFKMSPGNQSVMNRESALTPLRWGSRNASVNNLSFFPSLATWTRVSKT